MKKLLLFILVLASYTLNAQNTFYVAKTGSDNNAGTTGSPFLTIQKAVDVASNGDTILVNPGTYSTNVSINKSLNIYATGSYLDTVLESSNLNSPILTIYEQNFDFNNIVNVTVKGFKFRNNISLQNDQLAMNIQRAAFASIQNCWFENLNAAFATYYGYYTAVNCVFNNIRDVSRNDAGFTDDARLPKIINCTIYNSYSITNSGANIYNKIYNSIIVSDDNKTKSYFNGSRPLLDKVIIDDTPNPISGSVFSPVSNVNSIHFNDLATKDFRLKAYSPAIGYGTNMSITEDLSAGSRPLPVATTADAGAFENALGTPVNAPPTINTINTISINEDDVQQTIALSGVSDGDLFSTQVVAVTTTSSNLALIPNPTLTYTPGDTTGSLQFTPVANQSGTATITVTVTDDGGILGGGVNTFSTSFTVTVNPVNDAPVATAQTVSTAQDTNKVITLAGTDIDSAVSSLTYSITVLPTSGSLYQTTNGSSLGAKITTVPTIVSNSDGKVIYEPVWNVSGDGVGTFSFKVNDGSVSSSQSNVIVNTTVVSYPVISISANPTSFVENATSTIMATINQISSRDLVVPLTVSGTAGLDVDYTSTFPSKGEETLLNSFTINGSNKFVQLSDGRFVLANERTLIIYNPITKTQTTQSLQNYVEQLKVVGNIVYFKFSQTILKIDLDQVNPVEEVVFNNLNTNLYLTAFDVVGTTVYYNLRNNIANSRKIYSKAGSAPAVEVYSPTIDVEYFSVTTTGDLYVANNWNIQKIDVSRSVITNLTSASQVLSNISNIKLFNDVLYASVIDNNLVKIKKYNSLSNSFDNLGYSNSNSELIYDFSISENSNLQLLRQDSNSNSRILYTYQLSPQLKIPAGSTTGTLTVTGIDDSSDEADETIILAPGSVINATLSSNTAVTITITDNDALPTVAFSLSAPKIVEDSSTDVTLTATPSVVSGKEIRIPFTLSGTATFTDEYTVSANEIVIPANAASGSITISTRDKNDTAVEIMETIKFAMGTLVNATTTTTEVVLNLESDDNPIVTSIVAAPIAFAENASSTITATINLPSSKDVIVPIAFSGTAGLESDYTGTFSSKGEETLIKTFLNTNYNSFDKLLDGRYVIANGIEGILIYDPNTKTQTTRRISNYIESLKAVGNTIYYKNSNSIYSLDLTISNSTEVTMISNVVQNSIIQTFDVVGSTLYYSTLNYNNNSKKIYSKTGTADAVEVFSTNDFVVSFLFDTSGSFYLFSNSDFRKFDVNKNQVGTFNINSIIGNTLNSYIIGSKIFNNSLYLRVTDGNDSKIKKYNSITNTLEELSYDTTNIKPIVDFSLTTDGNLQLLRQESNSSNRELYSYQLVPQLKIPAGSTTGSITLKGIEDDLNYEGEEIDETILLNYSSPINSSFQQGLSTQMELKLLNNKISLTPVNSPFVGLEYGAVSWGDYDKDGDQDVAVMGQSTSGAVTKVYENKNGEFVDSNQNFTRMFAGDIAWVDINKDGWLDLAVSGSNGTAPLTKIYINDKGTSFSSTIDFGLPQLFSSKMAWGDLDNDGDIDLAMTGEDASQKYQFNIYYRDDIQNKFNAEPKTTTNQSGMFGGMYSNYQGVIDGDIKIVDIDLDGDNDIIYNGASSDGTPISNTLYNTYIKNISNNNNYYNNNSIYSNTSLSLKNSVLEVARIGSENKMSILSSGINQSGSIELYSNDVLMNTIGAGSADLFPKLKNGDISVVDYNNDGFNDILFTGEDASGASQTKLYFQNSTGNFKLAPIDLAGLRNSTANWVDYDNDGDLDLFLTGISSTGAKTLLYKSEILNKRNTAPAIPSGLVYVDLGNGKIKFQWTPPSDDYSASLGYVVRLGTTPGGTELSNTESNLLTGDRLITKQAPIYTTFYEMQLDPGKYYWSVQAVDTGLKGGAFAAESSFTLTYDWKILNQGGIIDRSITGMEAPIVKLADLDNDNDLDLIYSNSSSTGSQILQFDGKKLVAQENTGLNNIGNLNKISSSDVGDIDGDKKTDILVNYLENNTTNKLVVLTSSNTVLQVGDGLFKSKSRMVDINNDGKLDIVILGLSTSSAVNGVPKLWIYEYDKTATPPFKKTDASADIAALSSASFDFGDIDKDQDLDLVITGFSPSVGLKSVIYENTTVLGGAFKLTATDNNIVAIKDGTTDLIDFDGDGDLDVVLTGTGTTSDVFEIYMNKLNEGIKDWPRFASGLTAIRNGKIDLGDFNGDGFSDILYSGTTSGGGKITKLSEYNKVTQRYADSPFDVSDFNSADVEFGDLDGDNDLDFVIVGTNKNWSTSNSSVEKFIFRTYINVRNDSAKVIATNLTGKSTNGLKTNSGNAPISDYIVNEAPAVPVLPSNATRVVSNIATTAGKYPIELSWNSAIDDHTPSPGLSYAIKIGTTPGGEEIMSANANNDGTRKVSTKGNAEHNTKWKVSLPIGKYYWSVQAIDASYSGSAFTESQVFDVSASGVSVNNSPVAISDQITVLKGGTATKLNSNAISVLTNDTDTENNTLTAILVDNVSNGTLTFNANGTFSYVHNRSDTTTDSFSYKVNDGTSNSNTVVVSISIVPFAVDYNNFLIETKSETCSGKDNGEISIKATQSFNYTATINTKNYNFVNNSLTVPGLTPGVYNVCINITGQTFQQCYTLTIGKGGSLTGKTSGVSSNKVAIEITEGSAPFEVLLNGRSKFTTNQTLFDLDVNVGDVVMVKSAIACEGIYSTVISDLPNSFIAYPNPTKGSFEISVPTEMKVIYVELYSINAVLISKGFYPVANQKIQLNLDNQTNGTYIAKVYTAIPTSLMIIKN